MNERPWVRPPRTAEFDVQSVSALSLAERDAPWLRFQAETLLEPRDPQTRVRELFDACCVHRYAVSSHTIEFHEAFPPVTAAHIESFSHIQPIDEGRWDIRDRLEGLLLACGEDVRESMTPDTVDRCLGNCDDGHLPTDVLRIRHLAVSATYHAPISVERLLLSSLKRLVQQYRLRYIYATEEADGEWAGLVDHEFRRLTERRTLQEQPYLVFDAGHCPWLT